MHISRFLSRAWGILVLSTSLVISTICTPSEIFAQNKPVIQSESAILMDAKTGFIIYEKNIYKKQFPASITKIMTTLLAIENGNLEDTITFSKDAVYSIEWRSSHIGMREGEQISLRNALYGMVLMSANEVSNAIAEHIDGSIDGFSEHMTRRAKEIGAINTNFVNPHGLHDENHYTTAYDMALIARECLKYDDFSEIIGTITYTIPPTNLVEEPRPLAHQHRLFNQRAYPNSYYDGCEGGKTGFTDEAMHTLVTYAKRGDMELISVILKSEKQAMYDDTVTLLDYGFNHFKLIPIIEQGTSMGTFPIIYFDDDENEHQENVEVYAQSEVFCVLPKEASKEDIIKKISPPKKVNLPINKNEEIGDLDLVFENKVLGTVSLISSENIEKAQPVSTSQVKEIITPHSSPNKYIRIFIMIAATVLILFVLFFILILIYSSKNRKRMYYLPKNKLRLSKSLHKR